MKKMIKKIITISVFSLIVYYIVKVHQIIRDSIKLSKTLPEFLKNIIGEKPSLNISIFFKTLKINASFSKETLDKEDDIESIIREYIEDFFSTFSKFKIKILIDEKITAKKEEDLAPEDEKIEDIQEEISDDISDEAEPEEKPYNDNPEELE